MLLIIRGHKEEGEVQYKTRDQGEFVPIVEEMVTQWRLATGSMDCLFTFKKEMPQWQTMLAMMLHIRMEISQLMENSSQFHS